MMRRPSLRDELPDMIVGDMMNRWPDTVPVLVRHNMACPGCLMAPFMTVYEAAVEHDVPPDRLIRDLAKTIEAQSASPAGPAAPAAGHSAGQVLEA